MSGTVIFLPNAVFRHPRQPGIVITVYIRLIHRERQRIVIKSTQTTYLKTRGLENGFVSSSRGVGKRLCTFICIFKLIENRNT